MEKLSIIGEQVLEIITKVDRKKKKKRSEEEKRRKRKKKEEKSK